MELKKKYIHMSHEKGRAISQITLDDDYNVPESKQARVHHGANLLLV